VNNAISFPTNVIKNVFPLWREITENFIFTVVGRHYRGLQKCTLLRWLLFLFKWISRCYM